MQTIRVVAVQSSNMVAYYLQDQLQADFQREEQIKDGKITAKMADEQQEEWEQVRYFYCSFVNYMKKRAVMERVERPLLKSYVCFTTLDDKL
jgi:hypothetical protein